MVNIYTSFFKRIMKTNLHCFCRVLGATLDEGHYIVGSFPAYYLFNGLLCTLQVLNVFWFITIFRMVYTAVVRGQVRLLGRICVARTNLHGNQSRLLFSNNFVLVVVIWFLSCWCFFFQLVFSSYLFLVEWQAYHHLVQLLVDGLLGNLRGC